MTSALQGASRWVRKIVQYVSASRLMSKADPATMVGAECVSHTFCMCHRSSSSSDHEWRLEHGARVGTLDTLASSSSLTSAITSQVQLRIFSVLGTSLMLVWALPSVGGQASLRQIALVNASTSDPAMFAYMVPGMNLRICSVSCNRPGNCQHHIRRLNHSTCRHQAVHTRYLAELEDTTTGILRADGLPRGWIVALSVASTVMVIASLTRPVAHFFLSKGSEVAVVSQLPRSFPRCCLAKTRSRKERTTSSIPLSC